MKCLSSERLLTRLHILGETGKDGEGRRTRLAATGADKEGRDLLVRWMQEAGLRVAVDQVGNLFGIWETAENRTVPPVMLGSHIDTVIDAGPYDGCYGVLAGLEVIQTLKESQARFQRPIVVAAFTNEEGVRYAPDMLGSLVYAGGMAVEEALSIQDNQGISLGQALRQIGYAGPEAPGFLRPAAFVELHIEQGPILDAQGIQIGAVDKLQGISWQQITIHGAANHAGTTPTELRVDAGLAAAKVITYLRRRCEASQGKLLATTGCIAFQPNAVNVIPGKAVFTVDLRSPEEATLAGEEAALAGYLKELEAADGVTIQTKRMSRFAPVDFDQGICQCVEEAARARGLSVRRMTSGAGQDAQMLARICPTAMIFVPSVKGISHNPREFTRSADLIAGANILLDVTAKLAGAV